MDPEFWAIIGVGVAMTGMQWRLYSSLNISLGARVDALRTHMNTLGERMDRIEARLARFEADLRTIDERLARIEIWIAGRLGRDPGPSA